MATSPPCSCITPQQWSSAALHSLPSYGAAWHSTGLPRRPAPQCSRVVFSSAQAATYSLVRCNKALSSFLPLCVLMLCEIQHLFSFKSGIPTSQLNFLLQLRLWEPQLLHPSRTAWWLGGCGTAAGTAVAPRAWPELPRALVGAELLCWCRLAPWVIPHPEQALLPASWSSCTQCPPPQLLPCWSAAQEDKPSVPPDSR